MIFYQIKSQSMVLLRAVFFAVLLFTVPACSDDEAQLQDVIAGEYQWTRTFGGFGGWTITPDSVDYTRYIRLQGGTVYEYTDDELTAEYDFIIDSVAPPSPYSYFRDDEVIFYLSFPDRRQRGGTNSQTIILSDDCDDCYDYWFER